MFNKRHLIRDIVYNFGKLKRHFLDSTQKLRDGEQNYPCKILLICCLNRVKYAEI